MPRKSQETIITSYLRDTLKEIISNELENLPKQLEALDAKERLNVICKLLPYVCPRVESVHSMEGEPLQFYN
jgi:hypothetical protein